MKKWKMLAVATAMLSTAILSTASAAPISYNEATDGDLNFPPAIPTTLALGIGTNTVIGTFGTDSGGVSDFDTFNFTIPSGAVLSSGQLDLQDLLGQPSAGTWELFKLGPIFVEAITADSPGSDTFDHVPLASGGYNLRLQSFSYPGALPVQVGYTFTLQVTAVPEPGALALGGIGVAMATAIFGRNRRRRRRSVPH